MSVIDDIKRECPFTSFPASIDNSERKIDISLDILNLMNQYESFIKLGDLESAARLLEENPRLKQAAVTQEDFNRLRDGIVAVQMMFNDYISRYLVEFCQPRGDWDRNTKYTKYNAVTYEQDNAVQTYIAMQLEIPIGTLPTDINYWTCITMRGEKGDSGTGLTIRGDYDYDTNYYLDDFVVYNNCFWYAKKENIHQIPNKGSTNWGLLLEFSAELLKYNASKSTLSANTFQGAVDELDRKVERMKGLMDAALPLSGWSQEAPYTQTIPLENITEEDTPITGIQYPDDMDEAMKKAIDKSTGMITRLATVNGGLMAECRFKKPVADIPLVLKGVI